MDIEVVLTDYIKSIFATDSSGHDYFHSIRVYKAAMKIAENLDSEDKGELAIAEHLDSEDKGNFESAEKQSCDKKIIMMSALLHDVDDVKLFHTTNYENARMILKKCNVAQHEIEQVVAIIKSISYKGKDTVVPDTIEGQIVQDADRLDAIGAIGIARAFAYGGAKGRAMYNPAIKPVMEMNEQEYRKNQGTTINHFYEKLFLLKDLLNTNAAKQIANERQRVMEQFLEEFYAEWEGER